MQRAITVEEIANKLKPLFGKKIDELYFRYSVASSMEEKNEIFQIFTSLYQKHLSKLLDQQVLLSPPKEDIIKGEYPLGKVNYAEKNLYDFGLRERDWPRHVCVSGMSGSGKTTFAINLLRNFIEKDKPFLVFDWKSSFRPLAVIDKSLMTFTVGNDSVSNLFKLNINKPPKGVHPKEWINTMCDLLTESFSASFGVHKILLETLDEIFEGWGVYDGGKHYPNWQHVKKMLESKSHEAKGRETGWYESAMRIASVLTFGSFGKVVNYDGKRSLSIEDLFDKRVVLEMNSLSNIEKKFFSEYILTYIYKLKKANPNEIDSGFKHAILVDEAHNVFLKSQTNFMSESVTDMIYREMREYGTSLICLDQHVSKLSDTVTGNSACHIAFQQQLPQDIESISSLMQMREKRENFSQLPVGAAIVKLSERYTNPFLIKVPFMDLRGKTVSDDEVKSRTRAILDGVNVVKNEPEFVEEIKSKEVQPEENLQKEIVITLPRDFPLETINRNLPEITPEKDNSKQEPVLHVEDETPEEIEVVENKFDEKEKILLDFARDKYNSGRSIKEVESLLEQGLHEGQYTLTDIMKTINSLMEEALTKHPEEENRLSVKKGLQEIHISQIQNNSVPNPNGLSEEENNFIQYLSQHPNHENTTVSLYKLIGLSPRKGNVVKNRLLEKNLIKVEEVKYEKGWKKFIRLI